MVFWIGILTGGVFAWFAVRMGFYETWAMLFNIVIAIYLAVFLGPIIADVIPGAGDTPYSKVLGMISTSIGAFLILHGISYICFTSQFSVPFPRICDILGAGFLGFSTGLLIWSFVCLLICVTPISQNTFVKEIGFSRQSQQTNISYISWWCELVNTAVASEDSESTSREVIDELLKSIEKQFQQQQKSIEQAEPNEPAEPNVESTSLNFS